MERDKFEGLCDEGKCPRHSIYNSKTCKRKSKRDSCFIKYEKVYGHKEIEIDEEWEAVKKVVWERDHSKCRLLSIITIEEASDVDYLNLGGLDVAHIIRRSQSKKLYYNPDNLVLLHRKFHSSLDTFRDPIIGKPIDKERQDYWWKRIVGEENFRKLYENH